ncbi:hypothetical protein K7957_17840 [Sphingomonas yunnanensis]|uniref:hypothetical protein n=1 Tax=Sphingomonas yunnanensis TaxID=310400 RepID=UPI001CA6E800|nr:hypothetical protein [Sphingomonas yunnanensis]MBY9064803.1 hypothetical protein [Sphingomonas yunnanensis]
MKKHQLMLVGPHVLTTSIAGWQVWDCASDPVPSGRQVDAALVAITRDTSPPACLRALADAPSLPVLALAPDDWIKRKDWRVLGYDGAVATGASVDALADALADWHRDATLETLARLEASFGIAEVTSLVERFGAMLATVRDERDPAALADMAHRVAGIAGTLGFAALGRLWLRVSQGEIKLADSARRAAAHAIGTIARRG